MTVPRFRHFIGIDWSGAKGPRQAGIAVAMADERGGPPALAGKGKVWSRQDVLTMLTDELPADTLIGLDLGISLPFLDEGRFFPGWQNSPADARALWRLIDEICEDDPHLSACSFVDHPELSRYFRRHGGREGDRFHGAGAAHRRGRMRVTEAAQAAQGCKPYSNFNLVGAAQVGKSSLTGMRVLNKLAGRLSVWPIDDVPDSGSVVVEIYTSLIAIEAGRSASRAKITDHDALNAALSCLGCPPVPGTGPISDHAADALLTAAWLRNAANRQELWHPKALTPQIAQTEGWTFGAS